MVTMSLKDPNLQKEALLRYIAVYSTTGSGPTSIANAVQRGARLIDALDAAPEFGAAIEHVYAPEDDQHAHPFGMAGLALQAVQWLKNRPTAKNAPEWLRHTGVDFEWILEG